MAEIPAYVPDESPQIDAPTGDDNTPINPQTAQIKAQKANYGLSGKVQENYNDIFKGLLSGQENQIRTSVANQIAYKNLLNRNNAVSQISSRIGPLTPDDYDMIDRRIAEPDAPASIFEDHFAKRYMENLTWQQKDPDSTGWLKDEANNNPLGIEAYKSVGANIIAANQLIDDRLQKATDSIADESTVRRIFNIGKSLIPGYSNLALGSLFPGHMLQEEASKYHLMSRPEQVDYLDKVHQRFLNNPEVEAEYLAALKGIGSQERFARDMMLPVDIATTLGGGKALLGSRDSVKGAVAGMVSSVDKMAAEIAAPAAAGDLATAGVRRATDDTLATMAGTDPRRRIAAGLWDFFTQRVNDLRNDPSGFARELSNQIQERYGVTADSIESAITNVMKVERVPFLRAWETIMDDARKYVTQHLPSVDNKILNIGRPFKTQDGSWWYEIRLGNQKVEYFENPEAANAYARIHQIQDYSVEGNNITWEDKMARLANEPIARAMRGLTPERETYLRNMMATNEPLIQRLKVTISDEEGFKRAYPTAEDQAHMRLQLKGLEDFNNNAKRELKQAPADIAQDTGSGYYISIHRPWNEVDTFSRGQVSQAVKTGAYGAKTPNSLVNYFLGGLRSPEETMSEYARTQRGIATFGPNVLNKIAIQLGQDIRQLAKGTYPWSSNKGKWEDFKRILNLGRNIYDIKTQKPGYTFKNPGELEAAYRSLLQRAPDEQEIKAYFAWKQLNELDWTLRNLSVFKNKARTGAMDIRLRPKDEEGNIVNSDWFSAVPRNEIPTDAANIVLMGKNVGDEQHLTTGALRPGTKLGDRLRSGNPADKLQIWEIYDQTARPLEGFGNIDGRRVKYVIGNVEQRQLPYHQLPETGGGHFMYEYPNYLKQAIINNDGNKITYEGDKTLMAIRTRAEGRILEKHLNAIRELIRDGKIDEAKAYFRDNQIAGESWKSVFEMFKPNPKRNPRTGKMMKATPAIDPNEPIRLMDNNKNIGDAFESEWKTKYGNKFVNGLKSGNLATQNNVAFTGERDVRELMTMYDVGGKGNPVWNLEPAQMIDPIVGLNRGLSGIMNSFFFDDLKLGFMEHWLQEAAPYLKLRKNDIRNQAFALFHNPPYIKGNADQMERVKQLEIARQQHLQMVSRPGDQESRLMSIAQHLADAMYTNFGPKYVIAPLSTYAAMRDAPSFLRGMAFHFKLGMFNPSQLLKQLNTWATINGIEGVRRASQGAAAAMMHEFTRINENPEILDGMSKILERFGWRPGEFQEAMNLLKNTGFDTVAGEYASRDNIWSGNVVTNGKQRFLGLGDSFFTEGERNVRYGAFYTAYRRFRDEHPTGALSDADKEQILQRARLLNVNMDRAANSIWQHGLSSIPFQFQTYALRTAELMFGKRLTRIEKARLIGTYSLLYGLPVAGDLSGFPIADQLRKLAIDNNYNVGENYITTTLMEGVPSMLGEMITGHNYNIGEQYGGQGLSSLSNTLGSDPTWYKVMLAGLGGPSGGIVADTIENSSPLMHWFANIYTDGYNTHWEDVAQLFKAISTVRSADQTRMALETGNWYSRKGTILDSDIQPMDAIFQFLSGLSHQQVSDAYLKAGIEDTRKQYNKATETEFTDRIHKALVAAQAGSGYAPDQASQYFQDAGNLLKMRNYPIEDYHELYANAMKGWETMIDRIDKSFTTTHIPAGREVDQMQRYMKLQQLKNEGVR